MVHVQLAQDWTDDEGITHSAGDTVDVDAGTLARLESQGLVADPDDDGDAAEPASWVGPSDAADPSSWVGPSGGTDPESWVGPSGGRDK